MSHLIDFPDLIMFVIMGYRKQKERTITEKDYLIEFILVLNL